MGMMVMSSVLALFQPYFSSTSVPLGSRPQLPRTVPSRMACVLQPYFSPTAAVFQPYAALLQPLFSPNSALLLPYFSDTLTYTKSILILPCISVSLDSANSYSGPISALRTSDQLQPHFTIISDLFQSYFAPPHILQPYVSLTYFSPPGL